MFLRVFKVIKVMRNVESVWEEVVHGKIPYILGFTACRLQRESESQFLMA